MIGETVSHYRVLSKLGGVNRLELEQTLVGERSELNRALGIDAAKDVVLDTSFSLGAATPWDEAFLDELPHRRLDLIALQHTLPYSPSS